MAAGVTDFTQAVFLVRERGRLMQEAATRRGGGMVAILGLEPERVEEVCRACGTQIANINCPSQVVISGTGAALERAGELARERGASRVIPLGVSGAFHSSRMRRALRGLARLISALHLRRPTVPIVANTNGRPLTSARAVRAELCTQLCHCVQWQKSVEFMVGKGVSTFVEIGPRQVLSGLIYRINPQVKALHLGDVPAIQRLSAAV